jgi:NAD(P)-dependent dehydrogenase (short-subunit alcohol dehydrogenase family)
MPKNVLITGGNSGIGLELARALAAQGDRVIIASRDVAKSQAAIEDIKSGNPAADVEAMKLDLGDFADVDRFAAELLAKMPVIDVLALNSGLYTRPRLLPNGLEAMIGIMHFGHFRLTQHLLEAVKAAPQGRIVVTSSLMHTYGKIDEASFTDPKRHKLGMHGYAQAKLANLLFTRELARRLQGTRVTVNAFHPGGVATGIWAEFPRLVQPLIGLVMISPAKGADTAVWLATAPELSTVSGEYFCKRKREKSTTASKDMGLAGRLWEVSEERAAGPRQ